MKILDFLFGNKKVKNEILNLDLLKKTIFKMVQDSINKFEIEKGIPNSVGIYCCPRGGWISINFNISKTIEQTLFNCPDFEFLEFEFWENKEILDKIEKQSFNILIENQVLIVDPDLGDERINEIFFNFLKPLIVEISQNYKYSILLQMLDSKFVEKL